MSYRNSLKRVVYLIALLLSILGTTAGFCEEDDKKWLDWQATVSAEQRQPGQPGPQDSR